jgi:hypothetical protein
MDENNKKSHLSRFLSPELMESMSRLNQLGQKMAQDAQQAGEINRLISSIIPPALPTFVIQLGERLRRRQKISTPFIKCGLWLTPSMTPTIVEMVTQTYEQGKKRAIPAVVEGFYRRNDYENLKRAVGSWSSFQFFSPRMPIFYDALDAHINRKWTLSIPTLLPHIEGIAGEILLAEGLPFQSISFTADTGYKTYPSSVFGKLRSSKVTPTMDIMINSLLNYLEGTLYEYKDFKDYPKVRRLRTLNRHAILHGYQINYATRLNSLRCFLALDSLSMLKGNIPKLVE